MDYSTCNKYCTSLSLQAVISVVSCILEHVVEAQDNIGADAVITRFTSQSRSSITIKKYLERIQKYSNCSAECIVLSLIYIDRLIQSSTTPVTSLSIHRLIITSIMLAAKFYDDIFLCNRYYANIGGISVEEINQLEIDFLININFTLHVSYQDYYQYHNELYNHCNNGLCLECYDCSIPPVVIEYFYDGPSLYYVKEHLDSPCSIRHESCDPYADYDV